MPFYVSLRFLPVLSLSFQAPRLRAAHLRPARQTRLPHLSTCVRALFMVSRPNSTGSTVLLAASPLGTFLCLRWPTRHPLFCLPRRPSLDTVSAAPTPPRPSPPSSTPLLQSHAPGPRAQNRPVRLSSKGCSRPRSPARPLRLHFHPPLLLWARTEKEGFACP